MRQFTETEIKMAEKAVEIHAQMPFESHEDLPNLFYDTELAEVFCAWTPAKVTDHISIWIPLEHQLWEMLEEDTWIRKLVGCYDFAFEQTFDTCAECFNEQALKDFKDGGDLYERAVKSIGGKFGSLWELLFAFVMHELYGKVWNGEDWVKK